MIGLPRHAGRGGGGSSAGEVQRRLRARVTGLAVGFGGAFLLLAGYMFFLQVVRGFEFRTRASDVARRELTVPAPRGRIYDRTYQRTLATNRDSFALDIVPGEVSAAQLPALLDRLAELLNVDHTELAARVPPSQRHLFQPIELRSAVDFSKIAYIAEHLDQFPGITWHSEPIREYHEIGSLAHVVGYVGDISREELQVLFNEGYAVGATLGKSGVEKALDAQLRGVDGLRQRTVDVRERTVSERSTTVRPPEAGNDVVLTIDRELQRVAEQALGQRVGSAIVLEPSTGAILAMVSYPWFDANSFVGDGGGAEFRRLALDPSFPFINRAIQSAYPPASTFKIIMTAAVFGEETLAADHEIDCHGTFEFGDRVFNDWLPEGHGPTDLPNALAHSCDIYYYQAGVGLGVDTIGQYARDFGFGAATGLDLPGEVSGFVPTREWKASVRNVSWVGGDTVNLSIGQGFVTATPLQVANMAAMVVNGGVIYRPHVVREVRDGSTGQIVATTEPEPLHVSTIDAETFEFVRDAMRLVITDGTANVVLTTDAVDVAGKTGTSEVGIEDRFHSWFVAYGPYVDDHDAAVDVAGDTIVVAVMVEAVNEWEWWAPKAANLIFQAHFARQSVLEAVAYLRPWYQSAVLVAD